jgi:hypothetical protein
MKLHSIKEWNAGDFFYLRWQFGLQSFKGWIFILVTISISATYGMKLYSIKEWNAGDVFHLRWEFGFQSSNRWISMNIESHFFIPSKGIFHLCYHCLLKSFQPTLNTSHDECWTINTHININHHLQRHPPPSRSRSLSPITTTFSTPSTATTPTPTLGPNNIYCCLGPRQAFFFHLVFLLLINYFQLYF